MATKARVYSYLRFSDPKQAAGSSADRQLEYAKRWAAAHGMALDAALSMQDEGLSAYHQRHVTKGALGVFLAAIDKGRIPAGSVLIVEGLDRLSRAEPIQAQAQLAQIINAGITVVTASDGREYNRAGLKAQPMDLVYSLLVMIRAHEESDTKSKRVRAAIHRQCKGWQDGTWRGVIYRILRNRALIGEKVLEIDGEEYRLAGYYPALLSAEQFADLQQATEQRAKQKGTGEIPGLITGLRISYCGYCGSAMVAQNLMNRGRREDGGPQHGHRRLICVGNSQGMGCAVAGSCSVVPIEHAIMSYCADQMNLARLFEGGDRSGALAGKLAIARARVADTTAKVERITDAMLADDAGDAPAAFMRRARELEAALVEQQAEVDALEHELAAVASSPTPAVAKAWADLQEGVKALDYDARTKARQLVADTFERISIYHRGTEPEQTRSWKGTIDLVLVAKRGSARILHVDRQTGEWRGGEEVRDLPDDAIQ